MPKLYIANTSKQHHLLLVRLPEESKVISQDIRAGQQVVVGNRNLTQADVDYVVSKQTRYGLKPVAELHRNHAFVGLLYSVDKPVQLDHIYSTFEQNDDALNEKASTRREHEAASIASRIQETMASMGVDVPRAEVTVVEDTRGQSPRIAEGFEVVAEGVTPRHGGKRRASRPSA